MRIMTWRDLRLIGRVTFPATLGLPEKTRVLNQIVVMDDGHVIVSTNDPDGFQTRKIAAHYCVIKNNRVLSFARYISKATLPVITSYGQFYWQMDGRALLVKSIR